MRAKKMMFYLVAVLLGGCVPVMSLNPLYEQENIIFDQKLVGVWMDDVNDPEIIWDFNRPDPNKNEYRLFYASEEGKQGIFKVHLVKLKEQLFLDVFPDSFPSGRGNNDDLKLEYNVFFFTPTHTFVKVNSLAPRLNIQITNSEELEKLLEDDPNAIEYVEVESGWLVLTSSTKEIQSFVLKYADDKRLFGDEVKLIRTEIDYKSKIQKSAEPKEK
ncbi:MAG: hypothetical protein ACYSWP_21710 [Planctomycetota bacterium]|jgi:hypothetical protein